MKKAILLSLAASTVTLMASSMAFADGFVCKTAEQDLTIKVFNHTRPEAGTRNAAVMVLSDPAVNEGNQTIARFTDINETVTNVGATYTADVDLRYNDSNLKGRLISGTKLGFLKTIVADVKFSYRTPLENGESTTGTLTLVKRNGDEITRDLDCVRYLKKN
jgi:hypothetical protein